MTRLVRLIWLTAIWVALWSDISVANVLSGLLVAGLIVALYDTWRPGHVIIRPIAAARFAGYFFYQLVISSLVVARTVVLPSDRIRTGIVAVPLRGCSDAVVTLIADAISLTPGTLTVEVRREPLTLYVHALDVRDVSVLQREVRHLELLAVKAFGDQDALAGLAVDDTQAWRAR
jgi:multicomponent Na+:H+ antiporter subunit E